MNAPGEGPWAWLVATLRGYPEIAIFLTLGIGFWFGKLKFGKFSLGVVTSTLLAGVLVGQLGITISPQVKSTFFVMFLFAVGYGVGPQFFRGLKSDGLQQVFFAIVLCVACLLSAVLAGKILHYNAGFTAGLLAGAGTISAVLGVATDSINQLSITAEQKKAMIDAMPVAYAVTYLYGTAGSAWFLATIGPKLIGVDLPAACKEYEATMGAGATDSGLRSAYQEIVVRAYRTTQDQFAGKSVGEIEAAFSREASRVFVERVRQGGKIIDTEPGLVVEPGAVVVLAGRREVILEKGPALGPEVDDKEVLDIPAEVLDVVLTQKELDGKTLGEILKMDLGRKGGRGVFLRKVFRGGVEMPLGLGLKLQRGDVLTLAGAHKDIERSAGLLGYADRATDQTDMMFMGFGIVIGALIGALTLKVGGVPLSLSTAGGALIAGLVCGWLRSVHRTFGRIPAPALWVFNNVGLNTFIAVVGISAGPGFVAGLKANGLSLFLAGIVVTTLPFIISIYAGKFLFKMHPAILFGACAGARTTTAALGAIQDAAKSKVPALGYTVTYAVGNTLLTIWGVIIVLLMK